MKKQIIISLSLILVVLSSCEKSNYKKWTNNGSNKNIDYANKIVLDSLIKTIDSSSDTIFLGFTIGMTKEEYKIHINKLVEEGKKITYSNKNSFNSNLIGNFELGEDYTFLTEFTKNRGNEIMSGNGEYFLKPLYDVKGKLMDLHILVNENYNKTSNTSLSFGDPWIETKIRENSDEVPDEKLIKFLKRIRLLATLILLEEKGVRSFTKVILF